MNSKTTTEYEKLREDIHKYKLLLNIQQRKFDTQNNFVKTLKQDIQKMQPFVELTKILKEDSPNLWLYYANKTIHKHNNDDNKHKYK